MSIKVLPLVQESPESLLRAVSGVDTVEAMVGSLFEQRQNTLFEQING
jgi:hypothetical protein